MPQCRGEDIRDWLAPGVPWTITNNRYIVRTIIDLFGVDRCMFGSNFPVDSICGDIGSIFGGYMAITSDLPLQDRIKLFHDNAIGSIASMNRSIGYIGAGLMGGPMIKRLCSRGYDVRVFDVSLERMNEARAAGAHLVGSPADAAIGVDFVL